MLIKLKDYFTVGTILCGFSVLFFGVQGKFLTAALMIILGTILDLGDGFVARITKTGNAFGAEFDCVADLIIFSMAPGILIFFMFYEFNPYYALGIGVFPLLFGCIRLARFNVQRIEFPGYWVGLTRPGLAITIVALLSSKVFSSFTPYYIAGAFIIILSFLNISIIPYIGHHKRKFGNGLKTMIGLMLIILIASLFFGLFWDVLLIYAIIYLLSPLYIPKKEKKKLKKFIADWKKQNRG